MTKRVAGRDFKVHLEADGTTDSIDVEVRVTPFRLTG